MTLLLAVQLLELVAFVSLSVASLVQWVRRRQAAPAWLAATFGALALVVPIGWFIDDGATGIQVETLRRLAVLLLAWFPYSLYRFTCTFSPGSRSGDRAALVATGTVMVTSLSLPYIPAPGRTWPVWYTAFAALFIAVWLVLALVSVIRLWMAGRDQPALARRRMHLLAIAAVALTAAVLALAGAGDRESGPNSLTVQAGGLISAALFLLGFAPPYSLRAYWRRHETAQFQRAEAELMSADTTDRVAGLILPHAVSVVGGRGAVLVGPDGAVQAHHGIDLAAAEAMAAGLAVPVGPQASQVIMPTVAAVPMAGGWLAVATTPATPVFGSVELGLLQTLSHLGGLALERAELYDRERLSREALVEREAMLADAQRSARLGSYSWDVVTGHTVWSDEMHRILGYEPGHVSDMAAAFAARLHPDDRARVLAAWERARTSSEPSAIDYRIVLPTGNVAWLHGEVHADVNGGDVVTRLTGTIQDITARKRAEEEVAFHASHDALTLLPNRALFLQRLSDALTRRRTRPAGIAVLFVDLDRFKWLNDSLGHVAADAVLSAVAARLGGALRPSDTLARFGGDEFVVLCEDMATTARAESVAARLHAALRAPITVLEGEVKMTASIGVAHLAPGDMAGLDDDGLTAQADALLRNADLAMYRAKERGRDRYELYDHATRNGAVVRLEMADALRRGMARGELVVHYQPIVDLATGQPQGVEALARWDHPTEGLLAPDRFIPLAEETGLIADLGQRVLREACRQVAGWCERGVAPPGLWVSVNLSPRQLLAGGLSSAVEGALAESGLDPSQLCLEITERALVEEIESGAEALRRLAALGVRIGLDDFGTGCSSVANLKRLPVGLLKVDRSFVRGMDRGHPDRAIVANVVDLAHALGVRTVAEGVETQSQLSALRELGCDWGQGFLWSRALDAEKVQGWLAGHTECAHAGNGASALPGGVLIVDDDAGMRRLIRLTLEDAGHRVVAEAADGREAVALARRYRPGVVVLDLAMPGIGGLEALPLIQAMAPETEVVVFSGLDPTAYDLAGAHGERVRFLSKGGGLDELVAELAEAPVAGDLGGR